MYTLKTRRLFSHVIILSLNIIVHFEILLTLYSFFYFFLFHHVKQTAFLTFNCLEAYLV